MLRIHGSARSRTQRTLWLVFELGIQYEHDDLLPRSPGTKTPEFLALNPKIPTLCGGSRTTEFVLCGSRWRSTYTSPKSTTARYAPVDPRDEALAFTAMVFLGS